MKRKFNPVTNTVHFTFDGDVPELVFNLNKCSDTILTEMAGHGAIARVGDKAAITRDSVPGGIVTEAMRRAAMVPVVNHYESGTDQWELTAGPRAAPLNGAILALSQRLGKSYAETEAYVANMALADLTA